MTRAERSRWGFWGVMLLLVGLQYYARPRLFPGRGAPDFQMLALLLFAMRNRPGPAAVAGWIVGLSVDILGPARFGAGALAHTVVAWMAAWGRSVFFANNMMVNIGVFAGGVWLRNLIMLTASGTSTADLIATATVWGPLQALTTALAGLLVVFLFRDILTVSGGR